MLLLIERPGGPMSPDVGLTKEITRLPTNYRVERYRYKQTPNFEDLTFAGEETIVMSIITPSHELTLNALGLNIGSARFRTKDGGIREASISYDKEQERVTFGFDEELTGEGELDLAFTGDFKDPSGKIRGAYNGTYLARWTDGEGQTHYWATSDYEPTDARRSLVCADEPERKAVFEVTLVTPRGWGAVSNMDEREVYQEDDYDVHVFEPTPPMSSYLLANVVGEFGIIEDTDQKGIHHRVITTPGKENHGRTALRESMEALSFYADWTGIDFPLKKQDIIAAPEFEQGAMENWGAIVGRERALLIDPENSSQAARERIAEVVSHENAHMWFGDLVTPEWWTNLWLNESFATYMSYIEMDHVHHEWDVWDKFVDTVQGTALKLDSLRNTHPIEVEVHHPREIGEVFDRISYEKGAAVIDMIAHFIGAENFRLGTSRFLREYAYGNATTQDLLEMYEEVSGRPVREVMESWLHKPGYPVINVRDLGGELELSQERFFINERLRREASDTTVWQIPLSIREQGNDSDSYLMTGQTMRIKKPREGNWLVINEDSGSLVRVNYPQESLDLLAEAVIRQEIKPTDRYALIRDCFDLAQAGISSTEKALSFVRNYIQETNLSVWSAIAERLETVRNLIDGESLELREKFDLFALSIYREIGQKLGWEKKEDETNKDILLRTLVLANLGRLGDRETIRIAQERFSAHISGETPLDPDLRSVVYQIIAETGDINEYGELMRLYAKTDLHEEKARVLSVLGLFKNPEIIERVLRFAIPEEGQVGVAKNEAQLIMRSAFANPSARDRAWEFTKERWDRLLTLYGQSQHFLPHFIEPAVKFHSLEDALDIEEFFRTHRAPGAERTVQQTIESIISNADWLVRDRDSIVNFLTNYSQSNG